MTAMQSRCASVLLLLLPAVVWANAGTPLMWAKPLHLAIGNFLIAVFEAASLCLLLRPRKPAFSRLLLVLVPLNYASAGLGWWLFDAVAVPRVDLHIDNIYSFLSWAILASFVLTLLIEGPGIVWAFRRQQARWWLSLLAPLLGHLLSYPAMLLWYRAASTDSLLVRTTIVPAAELAWPEHATLWYIDRAGTQLRRRDASGDAVVQEILSTARNDRLVAVANATGSYDLHLAAVPDDNMFTSQTVGSDLLIADVATQADTEASVADSNGWLGSWSNWGAVEPLGESAWTVAVGHWPVEGLRLDHPEHGPQRLAMELPGAFWPIRNAQLLPGDLLVFQLGWDQICALHLPTGRLALLARGRGPAVGLRPP